MTSEEVEALSLDELNAEVAKITKPRLIPPCIRAGHMTDNWDGRSGWCYTCDKTIDVEDDDCVPPDYAHDIRAAWGLAEVLVDGDSDLELQLERDRYGYHWAFLHHRDFPVERGQDKNRGHGATPAEALARLFLKARRPSRVASAGD